MSRIRSVHPGQWSDEDFVSLSFPARLLAIAIRNECDDKGVFVWKPVTIKMRLFPADSIEVAPLLAEMVEAGLVRRYEVKGKAYGAVRNFRLFQRPKKPNDVYPLPPELRTYVGLEGDSSEPQGDDEAEVPNRFRTGGEIGPQMEEGEEKEEDTPLTPQRGDDRGSPSRQEIEDAFARFWGIYPRHEAKKPAREKFARILRRGEATAEQLIEGARRYAAAVANRGPTQDGRVPIAHAATWLNQGRWEDEADLPNGVDVTADMSPEERERWQRMVEERRRSAA